MTDYDNTKLFYAKTVQGHVIKTLFEIIKGTLEHDTNMRISQDGISIKDMDGSHTTLVHMKLDADKMNQFVLDTKKLTVGINAHKFYSHLKTIHRDETLTLFIEKGKENVLGFSVYAKGDSGVVGSSWISDRYLNILDVNDEELHINDKDYNYVIDISSQTFQKLCREFKNIASTNITIIYDHKWLILEAKGDSSRQKTYVPLVTEVDSSMDDGNKVKEHYHATFNLNKIIEFSKFQSLSNTIQICMKQDCPIIFKCPISDIGELKVCITPVSGEYEDM